MDQPVCPVNHLLGVRNDSDEEARTCQGCHQRFLVSTAEGVENRGIACPGVVLEPRGGQIAARPRHTGGVSGRLRIYPVRVLGVVSGIGHGVTTASWAGARDDGGTGAVAAQDAANITMREK